MFVDFLIFKQYIFFKLRKAIAKEQNIGNLYQQYVV